jgi:malate dehydrogenase
VTHNPEDIIGDVVVMAGGVTLDTDPAGLANASRDLLAKGNLPVFERFAQAMAKTRKGHPPVVIIVTNPVELGVYVFSKYIPREYVIGMGAYSDSLRFRWEIAHDLGIRRQGVHGYVCGEHGPGMVPLWSTVRIHGMDKMEWQTVEKRLRQHISTQDFPEALRNEQKYIIDMMVKEPKEGPHKALKYISHLSPDLRVALKPFAIHFTSAKTLVATASATVDLLRSILEGRPVEIAVQYQHHGESGINCPFGARLIMAGTVERLLPYEGYYKEEVDLINGAAENIKMKIEEWTSHGK